MTGTDIRLGIVRGITCGLLGEPGEFVPVLRDLGAGLARVFLYWNQIEPGPGRYDWTVVDAVLQQSGEEPDAPELWFTVCSSSTWATRVATDLMPPSPATELVAYDRFVHALVEHCGGRVAFWQCENEPCYPMFWSGSATEYLTQLAALHRAVRAADPDARVVLGGCPPSVLAPDADEAEHAFFTTLFTEGRFDVADIHLYGDPYATPAMIDHARQLLAGRDVELVVGEYNGPLVFEYPQHAAAVMDTAAVTMGVDPLVRASVADLNSPTFRPTARAAMEALYARMPELPPHVQMFMAGCPPELDALRHRINARQLVVRNVLMLAAGIRRTVCWNLAPEAPGPESPYDFLGLLFDKFRLMDFVDDRIDHRYPAADAFARLTTALRGACAVTRRHTDDPDLHVFEVRRRDRAPLLVAWCRGDDVDGEHEAPLPFDLPWPAPSAVALDALGEARDARVHDGRLHLALSLTPVFVTAG